MKKESPILFSTPMIVALLNGSKTMTRRILKPQPEQKIMGGGAFKAMKAFGVSDDPLGWTWKGTRFMPWPKFLEDNSCPYGKKGDVLWVRESFRVNSWYPDDAELDFRYEADGKISETIAFDDNDGETFNRYWIDSCDDLLKAGYSSEPNERFEDYDVKKLRLRPSIFLPKTAARIWVEITDIKVERLQAISDGDVAREGVSWNEPLEIGRDKRNCNSPAQRAFRSLWDKINGIESWDANPWLWCLNFKVLSTTGKP